MRVTRLNEGITHIEDLSIDKFIDTIKSIFKFHVSEKIDGANLWFGLDDSDIFYTTREQKSGDKDRKYESKDYSKVAAYNGFRSAHDALQSFMKLGKYRGALHPGDKIEIEVVFGKQPNVVKYSDEGINYIVLLRPVDGTSQEHFDKLVSMLDGKEVNVQSEIIDTVDGESLVKTKSPFKWKIVKNVSEKVSAALISHKSVLKIVDGLEKFLHQPNKKVSQAMGQEVSNFSVMTMRLVGISAEVKEVVRTEKELLNQTVLTEFKLPIKKKLFTDLMDKGEFLSAAFKSKEKSDLEGFVLSNGDEQIKIVDRDLFTAINEFNFKIRNELNGAVMSDDMEAPLQNKGGVFGNCKLRIANLFDMKELAKSAKAKKIFASYIGKTPEDTARNFAKTLKIADFGMYKTKIIAILADTKDDLKTRLDKFKQEAGDYKVKLKNGKTIAYSEESRKRTLLAFAELFKEIDRLIIDVKKSQKVEDLIIAIYGKFINDTHKKVAEEITKKGPIMSENLSLIRTVASLHEDGEGGDAAPAPSADSTPAPAAAATTSASIATVPTRLFNGKVLKRIKRNYFPKNKKSHK